MHALIAPLPTRGNVRRSRPMPLQAAEAYPPFWVFALLLASVSTLPLLAFLNARGFTASVGLVGLCELLVFVWCLAVQVRRVPPWTVTLCLGLVSWFVLAWLIRQRIDLKSMRDLMIPILFISLGRHVADTQFADRSLRNITMLLLVVALLEVAFTSAYGQIFNTFSFYAGLGSIREGAAMFGGQTLTLNGFRPEGIGRTLLPALLGAHRTSSLFLEPVSLGNFAVILLAWNLSLAWAEFGKRALLMCLAALVLIVLSDSRFGILMAGLLLAYRLLPMPAMRWVALAYPFALFGVILVVALFFPMVEDNLMGRISASGQALLQFNEAGLLGFLSPLPGFGDMGYAYVLSRFGALVVIALIGLLFLVPVTSERADSFRALIVLYFFSSLAISGTSVFALKTAGLLWFLFGALAADPRLEYRRLKRGKK